MRKWIAINVAFAVLWLGLNHPIDHALGIQIGSAIDWLLYMIPNLIVTVICTISMVRTKEFEDSNKDK